MLTAVLWHLVQQIGAVYVTQVLAGADAVNQTFGLVLGLMAAIFLVSVAGMLGVELNVVLDRHLWPRALLTPFTDSVRLTEADRRAYRGYAAAQRHKGFETVTVDFGEDRDEADGDADIHVERWMTSQGLGQPAHKAERTTTVVAWWSASSAAGRTRRRPSSPSQFGQIPSSTALRAVSAPRALKVQMKAASARPSSGSAATPRGGCGTPGSGRCRCDRSQPGVGTSGGRGRLLDAASAGQTGEPASKDRTFGVCSTRSKVSRRPICQRYVATSPESPDVRTLTRLPMTVMNRRVVGAPCCWPTPCHRSR